MNEPRARFQELLKSPSAQDNGITFTGWSTSANGTSVDASVTIQSTEGDLVFVGLSVQSADGTFIAQTEVGNDGSASPPPLGLQVVLTASTDAYDWYAYGETLKVVATAATLTTGNSSPWLEFPWTPPSVSP
jgi:hypothetical protein